MGDITMTRTTRISMFPVFRVKVMMTLIGIGQSVRRLIKVRSSGSSTGSKKRQLWENTILIVTADHGEEFGEHGGRFHGKSVCMKK